MNERKVTIIRERDLTTGGAKPGVFIVIFEPPLAVDETVSVTIVGEAPDEREIHPLTGKPIVLYGRATRREKHGIFCPISDVFIADTRGHVTIGQVHALNDACPSHTHTNSHERRQALLEPCVWEPADDVNATTVHPPRVRGE